MSVESSREAFLMALERLLSRSDAPSPGINTVSREAGLNKVLIYRYFGSWDGLLAEFARRVNPWRDLRLEMERGLNVGHWNNLRELLEWLFTAYLDRLLVSPLLQNVLRLSLVHRDPLQVALEEDREREGLAILQAASSHFPTPPLPDPQALTALLVSGITWMALVGPRVQVFNGLTFAGPGADAAERLRLAVRTWIEALTPPPVEPKL